MKLPKIVSRSKKRLGRGHGSGKVKTSGRGTKGQKARGTMPIGFEGGQLPMIRRLPFLRGKKRNRSFGEKPFPLPLEKLVKLPTGTHVTIEVLKKYHLIHKSVDKVKMLGSAALSAKLTVELPCSKSAAHAIEKAGGSVVTRS
ncbi:MAG: 50S ribosomal protein L15 [Patescibacteria group bacterium]